MPGQSSTSGYLITHTDAIDGPLDVSAKSTDAASDFEDHLSVTVAVNGVVGQTQTLAALLRHSDVARATNALPRGPVTLTVTIKFDPNAGPTERLRSIDFTLFVTVSNEVVQLPVQPSDPGGGVPRLPTTGQAISITALVLGGSLTGFGIVLVLRRRRRRPSANIAQGAD
jgi:LPXTG-motif cell wall-anchored protein